MGIPRKSVNPKHATLVLTVALATALAQGADAGSLKSLRNARLRGDFNRDGRVDAGDVTAFLRDFNAPAGQNRGADVTGNGVVDEEDLTAGLNNIAGSIGGPGGGNPPPIDAMVSVRLVDGNKLEMIDNATGAFLVKPNGQKLWQSNAGQHQCLVTPTITLVPQSDGCDLVFTFLNTTQSVSGLGKITIGGVRFGEQIRSHDFRFDGKPITVSATGDGIGISGWWYPGGTYSPVVVIGEQTRNMGFSIQYPIFDYKHQVKMRCKPRTNTTGFSWDVEYSLNPGDVEENKYEIAGDLQPGESRAYIFSVRVAEQDEPWITTLEPYKVFFNANYGSVQYARDPRPINFNVLAVDGNHEPTNRYGFAGGEAMRPDHNGFGPWADRLVGRLDRGYHRVMVSKPTGQFYNNSQNNIPSLFTSHWMEGAQYGHNMGDALQQFSRVPANGLHLGFWWGRGAQVMLDGWDTPAILELDPNDPAHVAAGFRELDLAYQAGGRLIGLDAFRRMQIWDAVQWIRLMQARAPGAKFITEPVCGDILHAITPAFQVATRPASEASLRVETRHYLADFLLPGHELWGFIREDRLSDYLGRAPTDQDFLDEANRVAALGYVPTISAPINVVPSMVAAESWRSEEWGD